MDATVWYEPKLDKTYNAPDPDGAPPTGEWKVLCRDDAVSVLAPKQDQLVLVGSGRVPTLRLVASPRDDDDPQPPR